jgi:phosphatidylserine/phosphatidylglycerophosphate/cardiolipin synthase-like enzyme
MECYSFTSRAISHALVDAQTRGVKVRVIFDSKAAEERGSQADYLQQSGIPVYSDSQYAIAHNKVIVVDQQTVLTGSFNYTRQAENSNAENLLVLSNKPVLAQAYEQNFSEHLDHSPPYSPGQTLDRENR